MRRFTRADWKSAPAATIRQNTGGQIDQRRSTQEYSRVTTAASQHSAARITHRSSAAPKGGTREGVGDEVDVGHLFSPRLSVARPGPG